MTRTFFPGSRRRGQKERAPGYALTITLFVIIALSIALNACYSLARAKYALAKREAAAVYAELSGEAP
jgi:hypothetical protein